MVTFQHSLVEEDLMCPFVHYFMHEQAPECRRAFVLCPTLPSTVQNFKLSEKMKNGFVLLGKLVLPAR